MSFLRAPNHVWPCVVCGAPFLAFPAGKNRCCSAKCSTENRRRVISAVRQLKSPRQKQIAISKVIKPITSIDPELLAVMKARWEAGLYSDGSPRLRMRAPKDSSVRVAACAVCGKEFKSYPSENKKCCSWPCAIIKSAKSRVGAPHVYTEEGRASLLARINSEENLAILRERMIHARAMGKIRPRSGPFETNHGAKEWRFINSEGELLEFRNMNFFCRKHFGAEWKRWASGLRDLTYVGRKTRPLKDYEYKGWRVA